MDYDTTYLALSASETISILESDASRYVLIGLEPKQCMFTICRHGMQLVPYMPCSELQTLLARPAHVPQLMDVNDCSAVYHVSYIETDKAVLYKIDV